MIFKQIVARRLLTLVVVLAVAGGIWWASNRGAPQLSPECRAWRRAVQAEARSYRNPQPEERTIEGAAKALRDTRPEGCPLPTEL